MHHYMRKLFFLSLLFLLLAYPMLGYAQNADNTAPNQFFLPMVANGDSRVQAAAGTPYAYDSWYGPVVTLYAYTGPHIALLVPSPSLDEATIQHMVTVFDHAYEYYQMVTGREPDLADNYNGLPTIAVVPDTCGAGCGNVGATGIEIEDSYFDYVYDQAFTHRLDDQAIFYEFGRNFWFYEDKIADPTLDSVATGYAVFMRHMAMGASQANGGLDDAQFQASTQHLLSSYVADPTLNWENTLKNGHGPTGGMGTDFIASFLFELRHRYGDGFINRFWQAAGNGSVRTNSQDAVDNFVLAASAAVGENLTDLFTKEWRWPLSASAKAEAQQRFGAPPMARQLFSGPAQTCATTPNQALCWGQNSSGQLGNGSTIMRTLPTPVRGISGGLTRIVAGVAHSCALANGQVFCWGDNQWGQLGDGANVNRLLPLAVNGLLDPVVSIAAGANHTCALTTKAVLYCWGANGVGQLGDGTTANRNTPTLVANLTEGIRDVAAGKEHTCVITNAAGVKCWGANGAGQLGDNTTTNRLTATNVRNLTVGVSHLTAGDGFTCANTYTGVVKCWGNNHQGQLGDGTQTNRLTPVSVVGLGGAATSLTSGSKHSCALVGSAAKCWGANGFGQLGDGTTTNRTTPVTPTTLEQDVVQLSAAGEHTCARLPEKVQCWGQNATGQLGDGTTTQRLTPVDVMAFMVPIGTPYDFNGEITNPNLTISEGSYGNLTGDGSYGWQTSTSSKDLQTNGFKFMLDSGGGNPLDYNGVIYGDGHVSLRSAPAGSGCCVNTPLILSGARPNQYTGITTLLQGVVKLSKLAGVTAIPSDLVMENQGNNDELLWGASHQIADHATLTINSTAGKLKLNGFQETVYGLSLVGGAVIDTGTATGRLTVDHLWYKGAGVVAKTYTAANADFVKGAGKVVVTTTTVDHRPTTIPALREWTDGAGSYTFSAATRILVRSAMLMTTATVLANDLRELTGFDIAIVSGAVAATPGDIVLRLNATDPAIGTEGYLLTAEPTLTIQAKQDAGVFYGTRTLLQLLKQSYTIAGGTARDWPTYSERSLMVDNGRKFFTADWLKRQIKELAYLKYNYFHLHLSDDQGFHLESTTVTPTGPMITKAELATIIDLATRYHVTIVPEIDMPGHMFSILPENHWLRYDNGDVACTSCLDIGSDEAFAFARQVIEEYINLFPGPYWHIGGDEFGVDWNQLNHVRNYVRTKLNNPNASAEDGFYYFINRVNNLVKAKGKRLRMWGNHLDGGTVLRFAPDITLELWDLSVDPNDAISRGYAIMNASFYPTYHVPGFPPYDPAVIYGQWTPRHFFAEQQYPYPPEAPPVWVVPTPPSPKLLGGKMNIWSDRSTSQTEDQIADGIYAKLRAMAQNNWGSPKLVTAYADFAPLIQALGRSPGFTGQPGGAPYNFAGEIVNPNAEIPNGQYGNLTGDGSYGWQTGSSGKDLQTNGFTFTLNSGDGNPLDYSGVIYGAGNVRLRSAPAGSGCCESEPLLLSGSRPNQYTGVTTLQQGVIELAKPTGVTAIPGDLVMENQGANDELRWTASHQIADHAILTIKSTAGKLNLNGLQETIYALHLAPGAVIDTGGSSGALTVQYLWYNGVRQPARTYTAANAGFVQGAGRVVVLAAPHDFADYLENPNQSIPAGHYGNLTGDGGFGWRTNFTNRDVETNGFTFTLDSGGGNTLDYSGVIYGTGNVIISSGGFDSECCAQNPLVISGRRPHQYTGSTTITRGIVTLAKPAGVAAIPGNLVIENQGDNDELRWAASEQIADQANLTMRSTRGKLNLGEFQETIHDLRMVAGAVIETSAENGGTLIVNQFWYNNVAYAAGTYTAADTEFIKGSGRLLVQPTAQIIKIMPLGDSITYIGSSYRGLLYTQLRQAGYNVDFVGTLADPAEGGDDPDHEGHNGAPIGPGEPYEWDGNDPRGYSDQNDLYHLAPTFMAQNPDVILLLIGINDYANYISAQGTPAVYDANRRSPAKLSALLDQILALKPDVKILVASLLPVASGWNRDVAPFNARIPAMVAQKVAAGKQVYFVDMNAEAGIDPADESQLYDGLHPTIEGSQKIATVWFKHLAPLLGVQPQIFADGFETGNLKRWSAQVTDNGDLAASPSAALADSYGMNVVINDNANLYVTDDRPYGATGYGVRFRFDPNAIRMRDGALHTLFYGYTGASTQVLRLDLRYAAGKYQLRAALRNDGATWKNSAWFTISDASHLLQLDWQAATAARANDGALAFYIDDVLKSSLTGVDNDTRRIDRVRLGAVLGIDTGTRGAYFFDDFASYAPSSAAMAALTTSMLAEDTSTTLEEASAEELAAEQAETVTQQLFLPIVTQ